MLHRIHVAALTALTILFYIFAAVIGWWSFVDTKPPFDLVSGKVKSFNPATHTAVIEWTALKNRHCSGFRSGWMRETHDEPPPRLVEYLNRVPFAPVGFKGTPSSPGSITTWRTDATVPASLYGQDVIYVARWEFSCNPLQMLFPLRIDSPLIEIKPEG